YGGCVQIENQDNNQQRDRHYDHEALFRTLHVFVLAAPENVVAARHRDLFVCDCLADGSLRHFHVAADVDVLHVDVNPGVWNRALTFHAHWRPYEVQFCDLTQWNLRTGRRRNNNLPERVKIFAEVAIVAEIDAVTFETFNGCCKRHSTKCNFENLLNIAER